MRPRTGFQPGGPLASEENPSATEDVLTLWRAGRVADARLVLVRATRASVYRYLKAMVRDPHVAEDLVQDTFLRAFQALGSYRGESRLTTWVLVIARNVTLNRARRLRLENRWFVRMQAPAEVVDPRGAPELREPRLLAALTALPRAQREAAELYYVEDMDIEEVARLTGRPPNTVKSDLHRARAALRTALGEPAAPATDAPGTTGGSR